MAKTGVAVDNYKLQRFKNAFDKAGIKYEVKAFTKETSIISMEAQPSQLKVIEKICKECELHFKRGN